MAERFRFIAIPHPDPNILGCIGGYVVPLGATGERTVNEKRKAKDRKHRARVKKYKARMRREGKRA